jgi:hypothetical protein
MMKQMMSSAKTQNETAAAANIARQPRKFTFPYRQDGEPCFSSCRSFLRSRALFPAIFSRQPRSRLEAVTQHADQQEADSFGCSDSVGDCESDPILTGIELHAAPERLFRKHVHRDRRDILADQEFADTRLEVRHLLPEFGLAPRLLGPAGIDDRNPVPLLTGKRTGNFAVSAPSAAIFRAHSAGEFSGL